MAINVAGLVVLLAFYLLIFIIGIVASRWKKNNDASLMVSSIVADRDINTFVGIFTMTATIVGGGYINGSAESIATSGLAWTLAPFGIFLGLILGGLIYAKKMRDHEYLTMLDPIQEQYGGLVVFLVYLASLCGDILWTASILSALGTSLSVILSLNLTIAIIVSAAVTVLYTMIGQMISVAYTDVAQLTLITFGLVLSLPFVFTNEAVGNIENSTTTWIGSIEGRSSGAWIDLFLAMIFGTIPWQSYFQRVLSVRSGRQAQILSIAGACCSLVLFVPSMLIGAASTSADWNRTSLGASPVELDKASMVLPYVLHEFTPKAVSIIGLGSISAAVMSSMDSSILGSSSMFTNNIYRHLFRNKASDMELLWIQRIAVFIVGTIATLISLYVPIIYGLFTLAADIVFVIVLPQLTCAVFFKFTNAYGAILGYIVGFILRIGAGEYFLSYAGFIGYPGYDEEIGHVFPFRIFAVLVSFFIICTVSLLTKTLFVKEILPEKMDVLNSMQNSRDDSSAKLTQYKLNSTQNNIPGEYNPSFVTDENKL